MVTYVPYDIFIPRPSGKDYVIVIYILEFEDSDSVANVIFEWIGSLDLDRYYKLNTDADRDDFCEEVVQELVELLQISGWAMADIPIPIHKIVASIASREDKLTIEFC